MLEKMPYWLQWLMALGLGAACVLAFAPFAWGLLVLVCLVFWLPLLLGADSVRAAAGLGYAFGLGLMGFGVFWLRNSIGQFGGVGPALALLATLGFAAFIALYFALFGGLLRAICHSGASLPALLLAAPALWIAVEWLRSWLLTGFPWLSLGYSQIDLPLAGFAPVVGVFGVGGLLVFSAGLLLHWRHAWPLVALASIWVAGLALHWVSWSSPSGAAFEVSLVQGNVPQADKWKRSHFVEHLQLYLRLSETAPDSRLLIWPETAIAGFDDELEQGVLVPLHERFAAQKKDLLTGIVVRQPDGRYYNAMISLGESGRAAYFKRHLVPFGEYLPLKPWLQPVFDFMHIPMSDFSSGGQGKNSIRLAGQPVGVDICYEDAFASEVLRALPEATVLINASNDAWFGDSLAPHQHLQIARMRALEAGRYLLRATNTGVSAIIDQRGEIRAQAPQFEQAVLSAPVQPLTGMTPYARWGDWPVLLLACAALLLAWRQRGAGGVSGS